MYSIDKLKTLVIKEATKLKELATPEELKKLRFSNLVSTSSRDCIYGQMTGNCYSNRAGVLITSCAEKVYSVDSDLEYQAKSIYDKVKPNGKPKLDEDGGRFETEYEWFSPIEVFINYNQWGDGTPVNSGRLIDFLKGETETLEFL